MYVYINPQNSPKLFYRTSAHNSMKMNSVHMDKNAARKCVGFAFIDAECVGTSR